MLQRQPRDPRHREFHDGEHEYNPIAAKLLNSPVTIPAALLSGLELVAAAVAAVLVVAALLGGIYVDTTAVAISHDHALLNVLVHNNPDEKPVTYRLALGSAPEDTLQEGVLKGNSDQLEFSGLTSETDYIVRYYTEENGALTNIRKDYRFTTGVLTGVTVPTDPSTVPTSPTTVPTTAPTEPTSLPTEPTSVPTQPTTVPTDPTTEPTEPATRPTDPPTRPTAPATRPTNPPADPTQPTTRPTEPTTAPTEPTTQPTQPTTAPTDPTTAPTQPTTAPTDPTTQPTEPEPTDPTEPTEPAGPTPQPPVLTTVTYRAPESGETAQAYYQCLEEFAFSNIPSGDYTVTATVDGEEAEVNTVRVNGVLYVDLVRDLVSGADSTAEVTVTWDDGSTCTETSTLTAPIMEHTVLTVTKNPDNTFTYHVTLTTAGTEGMSAVAYLLPSESADEVALELTKAADNTYTGSHTTAINSPNAEDTAVVSVRSIWDRAGDVRDVTDPPAVSAAAVFEVGFNALEPELGSVLYQDADTPAEAAYTVQQAHTAVNVPEGTPTVQVLLDGAPWDAYTVQTEGTTCTILVEHSIRAGANSTCQVTALWPDGTSFTTVKTLTVPCLQGVALDVTYDGDQIYTYTISGTASTGDGGLILDATLITAEGYGPMVWSLSQSRDGAFTRSESIFQGYLTGEETARVTVTGVWDQVTAYPQEITASLSASCTYSAVTEAKPTETTAPTDPTDIPQPTEETTSPTEPTEEPLPEPVIVDAVTGASVPIEPADPPFDPPAEIAWLPTGTDETNPIHEENES